MAISGFFLYKKGALSPPFAELWKACRPRGEKNLKSNQY